MSLNRIIQPVFNKLDYIDIPVPQAIKLDNGINSHIINAGTQEIIKIDLQFNAGSWFQNKPFIASTVNEMLLEGTRFSKSQQIAEKLDFFGAFIHPQPTKDFANISLYTLKKHLPETIKILEEVVKFPTFPEDEVSTFLNKRKQRFKIELDKVSNIARREFNQQIFGAKHPYGIKAQIEDYENITQQDLIKFHQKYYNSDNCKVMISGKVDDAELSIINQYFGNGQWNQKSEKTSSHYKMPGVVDRISVTKKENATQSAIRLGKVTINRDHKDYHSLNFVNTLLGGYFGSRLMKSIREEKGYTYGINSVLVSLKNEGYFVILSEVGANVAKKAIEDILAEVKKLREEPVGKDELELVRNYMLGDLMRSFDGAFEIASSFKHITELGLNLDFYETAIETIQSITADEVQEVANKYLHEDTFVKTIAGKYN